MVHHHFEPVPCMLAHLRRLFHRVGDTRVIERTNQKLRQRYKDATTDSIGTMELFRTMTLGDVLKERGLSRIELSDQDIARARAPEGGWHKTWRPDQHNRRTRTALMGEGHFAKGQG